MPPELLALTEGASSILLDKPILLLGRHQECDIQLNSRKVSRRHCCLAQVSDYLVVRDLGSTNGVRVNGEKVTAGRLGHGDELTIGNFQFRVDWPTPDRGPHPAAGAPRAVGRAAAESAVDSGDEPRALAEAEHGDLSAYLSLPFASPPEASRSASPPQPSSLEDQGPSLIPPDDLGA